MRFRTESSNTYFELSQAYEAHERALSWETSSHVWSASVRTIEMYHGLIPVPDYLGEPVSGLRRTHLNELLELRAEKKDVIHNSLCHAQLEGLSDDEISELITLRKEKRLCLSSVSSTNILHQSSSIHLIPAGTALVNSLVRLGIRCPPHNDSVANVCTGRCLIQPAATVTCVLRIRLSMPF